MPCDISQDVAQPQTGKEPSDADSLLVNGWYRVGRAMALGLDGHTLMQHVTHEATALTGAQVGAFFCHTMSDQEELSFRYTLAGAPRDAFAACPVSRNIALLAPTIRGEGVLRLADVKHASPDGQGAPGAGIFPGHLPVRSYLAVPVISRTGAVVGGLFFGHPGPGVFTEREERLIVGLAAQAAVALDNARLCQQTKAEAQLRRRWQGVFDYALEAILLTDDEGRYTDANAAACALTGYDYGELLRLTACDLTPGLQREHGQQLWQTFLAAGSQQGTYTLCHKAGRLVEVEYRAVANIVPGIHLSVLRDITERQRAEARQHLLTEVSAILATSFDYPAILDSLAHCIVPSLADWCVIDMLEEDEWVAHLALAHKDPHKAELLQELKRRYPRLHTGAMHTLLRVLRTRQSWLRPELPEDQGRAEARDPHHWQILQALGLVSEMIVPLIARGRVLGTITFVLGPGDRRYGSDDLALAEDLARRCALTIDNARLYGEMHAVTLAKEESLALLNTLLASAPIGLGFLDRECRYVRLNQALADINGLPIVAHLGRTPHELNPQLTPVLDPLRRYVIENGKPVVNAQISGETRAAPGQRRHWLVSYYPVFTTTRSLLGLGIVVTDITERQQIEETLRQARDELERRVQERTAELVEANARLLREIAERQQAEDQVRLQQEALLQREKLAAMGSLLASVAHELNNPLSIVMMQADLLREQSGDGPLMEHARSITQAVERCMRIVQHFLTLARQHPPERRPVPLNTIVEEVLDLLAYGLRVDNIEIDLQLAPDLPTLPADRYQLQQVVVNLVTNAQQALRDVPLPRRLTLVTRSDPAQACLRFEVADTGLGIPLALQSRIFEPFFTTKPHGIGTGLGLSLCRGIVEGHGGTMSVQSQPGQGTIFSVELPVQLGGSTMADAPWDDAHSPHATGSATILVIDDEPGIASALVHILSRSGHTVETAANGRLALAKLAERTFDLILCDLRMPELDGPGLYQELARRYPQLLPRIIFLTGDTLSPEARAFLEQVGGARLHKPFRAAEVRRIVQQALQALC